MQQKGEDVLSLFLKSQCQILECSCSTCESMISIKYSGTKLKKQTQNLLNYFYFVRAQQICSKYQYLNCQKSLTEQHASKAKQRIGSETILQVKGAYLKCCHYSDCTVSDTISALIIVEKLLQFQPAQKPASKENVRGSSAEMHFKKGSVPFFLLCNKNTCEMQNNAHALTHSSGCAAHNGFFLILQILFVCMCVCAFKCVTEAFERGKRIGLERRRLREELHEL